MLSNARYLQNLENVDSSAEVTKLAVEPRKLYVPYHLLHLQFPNRDRPSKNPKKIIRKFILYVSLYTLTDRQTHLKDFNVQKCPIAPCHFQSMSCQHESSYEGAAYAQDYHCSKYSILDGYKSNICLIIHFCRMIFFF